MANALGLPSSRELTSGREQWGYADGPALESVDVPYSPSPGVMTTRNIAIDGQQELVMIYVFDKQGILVEVQDYRSKR